MIIEQGTTITIGFSFGTILFGWIINQVLNLKERMQRVEDVQGTKVDELKIKVTEMEVKIDHLTEVVHNLSSNIHKSKNEENALNATLTSLQKTIEHWQNKTMTT